MDGLTREFVAESQEGLERMEVCLTELEQRPGNGELVAEIFRVVHTMKGGTGFLGFRRLQALAHEGEGLLAALREGTVRVNAELIGGLLALADGLRSILKMVEETGGDGAGRMENNPSLMTLLAELRRGAGASAGEADGGGGAALAQCGEAQELRAQTCAAVATVRHTTVRVDVEVLDRMMNLVGDLVLTRNQMLQVRPAGVRVPDPAHRLDQVTTSLRESVMEARLQPIASLFGKFPRLVRDISEACGRQVRLELEGEETGLDKSLLEAIRDPLTHAVRNAVDHGIEPARARVRAGKPAEGVVRLRASQESGWVVIEVIDDGAGISKALLTEKAVERGLIPTERAGTMGDGEALQLIFVPGFSTARKVTNLSGRGVGMDVVRSNVERAGGRVEVESQVGVGTTVRMRVPLTLAIIPALVVECGGERFALPQSSIVELVYVPRRDAEAAIGLAGGTEIYRLRDEVLHVVRLGRLLGLKRADPAMAREFYVAVVEAGGRRFGLIVDGLRAREEIVVKPLPGELRGIDVFSGATLLGDGTLALILDAGALGVRAGVGLAEPPQAPAESLERVSDAEGESAEAMVIYERWAQSSTRPEAGGLSSMPLSAVERVARVPLGDVEYADGRTLLRYGGEYFELEDEDGVPFAIDGALRAEHGNGSGLRRTRVAPGEQKLEWATVLMCMRPGAEAGGPPRQVALLVRRVVDVRSAPAADREWRSRVRPFALVSGLETVRAAGFNPVIGLASARWREVA